MCAHAHVQVERRLSLLTDERMVLKDERFADIWPERRLDCMREAVAKTNEVLALVASMDVKATGWSARSSVKDELAHAVEVFTTVRPQADNVMRDKDDLKRKFDAEKVPFDWAMYKRIHHGTRVCVCVCVCVCV